MPQFDPFGSMMVSEVWVAPTLRRAGEKESIGDAERRELLVAARRGEVVDLELDLEAFAQTKTPRPLLKAKKGEANWNFFYFPPEELERFAGSFVGGPFLRDHERDDLLARGGEIVSSQLIEARSRWVIAQTVRLVKPWAIESALDRTIRAFSIGWDPPGSDWQTRRDYVLCTACGVSLFSGECSHMPGDHVKVEKGNSTVIVEAEFRGAIGAEVSAVSFPAVKGTRVDSIRQALSEYRGALPRKAIGMTPEQLKAIGLAADATPEQIAARLSELASVRATTEELRTKLAAAEETGRAAQSALQAERQARAEQLAAERKASQEAIELRAREGGLWEPGSPRESLFRKLAARDLAEAEEFVASLDRSNPVGMPSQARSPAALAAVTSPSLGKPLQLGGGRMLTAPSPKFRESIGATLAAEYAADELQVAAAERTFAKLRITPAMFAAHGPHAILARDPDEPWLDDGAGSLDYRKGA